MSNNLKKQSGQTLIETIVAIFILTTALTSGLGLTIYILANSGKNINEIVATNLAREGAEVVRNMRDTNWLAQDGTLTTCGDIGGAECYPNWLTAPTYALNGTGNFRLVFNPSTGIWSMSSTADYDLFLQSDGTYQHAANGTVPTYASMVNISQNTTAPFTASNPELIVTSVVAWRGKNCTSFTTSQDLLALSSTCKVVTTERLTNWRDY